MLIFFIKNTLKVFISSVILQCLKHIVRTTFFFFFHHNTNIMFKRLFTSNILCNIKTTYLLWVFKISKMATSDIKSNK